MALANTDQHHPSLVLFFGILGNFVSFLVYLAPIPTFYRIYDRKSSEGYQSLPYLMALISSELWLYYSQIKENSILLATINGFGSCVELVYIFMFVFYASKDRRVPTIVVFVSLNVLTFFTFVFLTRLFLYGEKLVGVVGWTSVAVSLAVFAAPMAVMVVRTKSVEFMPFLLSLFLTLSAVIWFFYGVLAKDICVAIPNVLGFVLGVSQMVLYVIFRNKEIERERTPPENELTTIAINL